MRKKLVRQIVKNYIAQLEIVGGKSQFTIGMYLNGIESLTKEEIQYGLTYYEKIKKD